MPCLQRLTTSPDWTMPAQAGLLGDSADSGKHYWIDSGIEPTLADLLSDPIVDAVMRADGIRVQDVLATVAEARHRQRPSALRSIAAR
jgi:hypothetical protein